MSSPAGERLNSAMTGSGRAGFSPLIELRNLLQTERVSFITNDYSVMPCVVRHLRNSEALVLVVVLEDIA